MIQIMKSEILFQKYVNINFKIQILNKNLLDINNILFFYHLNLLASLSDSIKHKVSPTLHGPFTFLIKVLSF